MDEHAIHTSVRPSIHLSMDAFFHPSNVLFWSILCCSQSGDDPQDDLAMFGYKLNMKATF